MKLIKGNFYIYENYMILTYIGKYKQMIIFIHENDSHMFTTPRAFKLIANSNSVLNLEPYECRIK